MEIRRYQPGDIKEIAALFHQTIHSVNAKDYTKEQLKAWSSGQINEEMWNRSFSDHHTVVAVISETIVGFGDMTSTGYLNRLYVHKDYQRQGIATAICDALEAHATAASFTTEASVTAKPFFENRGYRLISPQQVERRGVFLTNFRMKKENHGFSLAKEVTQSENKS